jgi:hypothetical protein
VDGYGQSAAPAQRQHLAYVHALAFAALPLYRDKPAVVSGRALVSETPQQYRHRLGKLQLFRHLFCLS